MGKITHPLMHGEHPPSNPFSWAFLGSTHFSPCITGNAPPVSNFREITLVKKQQFIECRASYQQLQLRGNFRRQGTECSSDLQRQLSTPQKAPKRRGYLGDIGCFNETNEGMENLFPAIHREGPVRLGSLEG